MTRERHNVEHCAAVILAAGTSSRLGSPKQFLVYKGKTLLRHTVETALASQMHPVVVVVGANETAVVKEIEDLKVEWVTNEGWQEGMASSIRVSLAFVRHACPETDGVIFTVCDQPFVTKELLNTLLHTQQETGLPMVASSYEDKQGTPALFHKSFFDELMTLKGDTGARKLIKQHEHLVATVAFPKGIIDIDTNIDYQRLLQA